MIRCNNQRWFYWGCCLLIALMTSVSAIAQTKAIKGKVVDDKGQPMIGVSVVVKGTKGGTISDVNGNFTISAASNDVLKFSFVGYKSVEQSVNGRSVVNVTMAEDANMLQETVVTAEFGVKRAARSVGAAVQSVKGAEIAESGRENFVNALQGRVAGVNIASSSGSPGASSTVVFRSPTSISGNNSPLYVIDGIPMSNTTFDVGTGWAKAATSAQGAQNDFTNRGADIDPDNIESMTILKGAAAAALYGSDASNGAIIITTKKGKAGSGKVSYSNSFKFDKVNVYPELQTMYDQGSYGTTNYYNASKFGAKYADKTVLYNNLENLFQTGLSQKHNVSFEAGTEKLTLRASAGLIDQTGVIPTASYKRKNVSFAGTAKLNKWVSIDGSMQYVNTSNNKVSKYSGGVLDLAMRWPLTDDMTDYLSDLDGTSIRYPNNYKDIDILNPYFDIYRNKRYDTTDRLITSMNLTVSPIKNLDIRAQVGWDVSTSTYITSINPQFTTSATKSGSFDQSNVIESNPTLNLITSYKADFGKFEVTGQVGYHQLEVGTKISAVHGEKFLKQDFHSINNCDPTSVTAIQNTRKRRIQAVSGSVGVSYNNMAFVTLRGRNDWSSTLPEENRSYFYPAADVSFMVSELPFMKEHESIWNYVKLRGSVAKVGKDAPPLSLMAVNTLQTTLGSGYAYGFTGPNLSLKPEMNTAWEIGLEARLLNDRLNIDWSYYNTKSEDQIITGFRMSYATGFVLNNRNMGSFETKGTELLVSYDFIKNKNWNLNIGINGSKNWSKVLSLPDGISEYYLSSTWLSGNLRNGIIVGNPITTITGNDYQRNNNGQILIDPSTGLPLIASSTWSILGDRAPDFNYGITASLKYKNFALSCLFNGKVGMDIVNGTKRIMMQNGSSLESVKLREMGTTVFNGIIKDGKENSANPTINTITARIGDLASGYAGADPNWIEKNINYLNLSELRFTYSFDKKFLSRITSNLISNLSVFAAGTDLLMWTNYSGIDPVGNGASSAVGGTGAVGFDVLSIGATRGLSFGMNITF